MEGNINISEPSLTVKTELKSSLTVKTELK